MNAKCIYWAVIVSKVISNKELFMIVFCVCSDEALTAVLNRLEECIKQVFSTENTNTQKNAALLHVYVTKALVLRGHTSMHHWLDKV